MAVIDPYTSSVLAQGQINSQASPADFGAQVGAANQNLAEGVGAVSRGIQELTDTQDITSVHVELAKKRAAWTQEMQNRENAAVPGDDTFAPRLMDDLSKDINTIGDNLTSRRAQRLLQTMSATMVSEFGQRAVGVQSELAGKAAVNSYNDLVLASGQTVYADQSQYEAVQLEAAMAIQNGEGMFGKVPKPARDAFLAKVKNDIDLAAARGYARRDPAGLLASVAPDQLQQFEPAKKIVESNNAPGATANISKGAMQWAPQVQQAAAARGVNPNILLAQIDKESSGNPRAENRGDIAVTGSPSQGLAQFQPGTAKQYGVTDPFDPKQAIPGQAAYMADLLKKYGGNYQKALAAYNWGPGNLDSAMQRYGSLWADKLPASVKDYVSTIMTNAGQVAQPAPPGAPAQPADGTVPLGPAKTPVASSLPYFKNLSWEQQDAVVGEAVRLQNMRMAMAERARAEAERAKKDAQDKTMDGFITRIITPGNQDMPTDDEIAHDPTLSWQQKQHAVDYKLTRTRELAAGAESKTNPTEVRALMLQIHAADDDPTKTYNLDPVMESYKSGRISTAEFRSLRTEVEQLKDGTTQGFQKDVNNARNAVYTALTRSILGQGQPEVAADAAYRFNADMERQISELRKQNKDPRVLLDPSSRDYLLKPERIQSFMPQSSEATGDAAAKVVQQEAPTLPKVSSQAEYDALPKGALYTDPQGNVRTKK